jgi:hypothetical protein
MLGRTGHISALRGDVHIGTRQNRPTVYIEIVEGRKSTPAGELLMAAP